jgi:nucleoid DNA-binding protein
MTHKANIRAVARRFPELNQREIEEVLQVFIKVWQDQLEHSQRVVIHGFGSLSVELQALQTRGAIHKPTVRLYIRFRPTQALKTRLKEARR